MSTISVSSREPNTGWVGPVGLEPTTRGLKGRRIMTTMASASDYVLIAVPIGPTSRPWLTSFHATNHATPAARARPRQSGCSSATVNAARFNPAQDPRPGPRSSAGERPTIVFLTELPANPVMDSSQSAPCVLHDSSLSMSQGLRLGKPSPFSTPSGSADLPMSRSQRASRNLKPGPRWRNGVRGGSGPGDSRRPRHPCRRSCTTREHVARRPRRGHRYRLRGRRRACAWIACGTRAHGGSGCGLACRVILARGPLLHQAVLVVSLIAFPTGRVRGSEPLAAGGSGRAGRDRAPAADSRGRAVRPGRLACTDRGPTGYRHRIPSGRGYRRGGHAGRLVGGRPSSDRNPSIRPWRWWVMSWCS